MTSLASTETRTTPYHPQSDGLIEKFNHTLITTVSMLIEPHNRQRDWDLKGHAGPFRVQVVSPRVHWRDPQHVVVGQGALVAD